MTLQPISQIPTILDPDIIIWLDILDNKNPQATSISLTRTSNMQLVKVPVRGMNCTFEEVNHGILTYKRSALDKLTVKGSASTSFILIINFLKAMPSVLQTLTSVFDRC